MALSAEIIAVGSEILLGNIVNTNARDLSVMLSELGINVYWHTTVGDNPERLRAAVERAKERADIIITTGGLGPTCDDLTRQTVCQVFGAEMYFDERARAEMEDFFRLGRGGTMTENNLAQCWLPKGCTPFYNTCGTAPGCGFTVWGKTVLILPGPPKEMNAMMLNGGIAFLRSLSTEQIVSHNIHIFGLGESYVESLLRTEMNALQNPTLAPYAKEGEVRLRVTAKAASRDEAEDMMDPVIDMVVGKLGHYVYGIDSESLENTVFQLLKARGLSFAAAESCTGGLIAKRITDIPGSSAVFRGGCTVYTNEAKMILLGVPAETIDTHGVISAPVALALAENVRKILGADFGLGVTGLAGPDGDGINEVGTVFVALASAEGSFVRALKLGGKSTDRSRVRTLSANHAFDMLRRAIRGLPVEL